jgi:hypothetical protein
MDRDVASKYAQDLKDNPLLEQIICGMENVCYTNIKKNPITSRDIMDSSCLMLQCIDNFKTLVNRSIEDKKPVSKANMVKQIKRVP